jgi:hypothetical protein
MKEISFNIGDRIVTVKNGELLKGVIKNIYPMVTPPIFAIKFEDGTVEKIPYNNVAPEPKTETAENEIEPEEDLEITITSSEFKNIACRVIAEETKDYPIIGYLIAEKVAKIHKALFSESREPENFVN